MNPRLPPPRPPYSGTSGPFQPPSQDYPWSPSYRPPTTSVSGPAAERPAPSQPIRLNLPGGGLGRTPWYPSDHNAPPIEDPLGALANGINIIGEGLRNVDAYFAQGGGATPPGGPGGGSGGGGYSSGGGGGGAAAPPSDPLAELEAMLKGRMQDQIKTIRETYKPLFQNLRKDRKRSRREIRATGRNARQGMADEQAQMQQGFDAANAAAAEATMPEGIDAQSAAEIAAARAIFGESRAARQENANIGMDRIQAMSRGMQQAGLSTLANNSADLISQLRAQRAQEVGAQRTAFNDAVFQLRAGQLGAAAGGGGGGGRGGGGGSFRGGSSGGDPGIDWGLIQQGLGTSMSPELMMQLNEIGFLDNALGYEHGAITDAAAVDAERDFLLQQAIGIQTAINNGTWDPDWGMPFEITPYLPSAQTVIATNQAAAAGEWAQGLFGGGTPAPAPAPAPATTETPWWRR